MINPAEKRKSYGKIAKVGVVWGFIREAGTSMIILPTSMILARLLTPEEAGIAAAAAFFMQLCARLTQFGFGASLVRSRTVTPQHLSSVFTVNLAIGFLAWGALTLFAPAAGAFLRSTDAGALLPTAALAFLIMPFGTVPTAIMSREMRHVQGATSEWVGVVMESVVAVLLAGFGFSFWSLVYARLAADSSRAVCRLIMTRWFPRIGFSLSAMREMFSFGAGMYSKHLLDFSAQNIDNLVVGRMLGMTALGFYDKAFTTMHKLTRKLNLAGPAVSFRIFAMIHDEPERFRRAYRKVILSATLVGYSLVTGMIVTAPQLIEVLFGPKWLPAVAPFQVLCAAAYLRLLNTYASTATQAKGQIWSEVKRQGLFTVLLLLSVAFFSRWGITGAAFGVLLSTILMTVMLQILVHRLTKLSWWDLCSPQIPGTVCAAGLAALLGLVLAGARAFAPATPAIVLLLLSMAAGTLYYVAFLKLCPFPEVRSIVRETAIDLAPGIAKRLSWVDRPEKDVAVLSAP